MHKLCKSSVIQKQKTIYKYDFFVLVRNNLNLNGNFICGGTKFGVSFSLLGCSDVSESVDTSI